MAPSPRRGRRKVTRIPKARRADVGSAEFNSLIDTLNQRGELLNRILQDQEVQFHRIAQIQAELDLLKKKVAE